jgi:plastocyanin
MKHTRILIALAILLSGMALLPYVALPNEGFRWQRFADAYVPLDRVVTIEDFAYDPMTMVVPVGTTIHWTNMGAVAHTVTSDTAVFDSGTLQPGDTFSYQFNVLGTFPYHCSLHPTMTGTVIVVPEVFRFHLPVLYRSS